MSAASINLLAQVTTFEEAMIKLVDEDILIPLVAIVLGCLIAIIAIIFTMTRNMVVGRAREATKRELAAYVAEGTMTPDQAVAIIKAGESADE